MNLRATITFLVAILCGIIILSGLAINYRWDRLSLTPVEQVHALARESTVQIMSLKPALAIVFKEHYYGEEVDEEQVLQAKIEKAIEEERNRIERYEDRYQKYLTEHEVYGYKSISKTSIPLGALVEDDVRFPERVLVVYQVEEEEIDPWDKKYTEDVMSISSTANVSPNTAKEILANIKLKGYSITKDEIKHSEGAKLLWFDGGWDSKYPKTLDWKVCVEGEEDNNLIIGYDPRGILEVKPIPKQNYDLRRVYVKFGYLGLKPEFKKSQQVKNLENEIEELKKQIPEDEEDTGADITKVTWEDVFSGRVLLLQFYMASAGTGIYIGDLDFDKIDDTKYSVYGADIQSIQTSMPSVILTNEHITNPAYSETAYVSDDKKFMVFTFPAEIGVRYTDDSERWGAPAAVLAIDNQLVVSKEIDTGILVTTQVQDLPKVELGNSDNVIEGQHVLMVGHPLGLGKMSTRGVVSNVEYNILNSYYADYFLPYLNDSTYRSLLNACFWFDTTIGTGGTSGSGVWMLEGAEHGKVVAVHNSGMGRMVDSNLLVSNFIPLRNLKNSTGVVAKDDFDNTEFKREDFVFQTRVQDLRDPRMRRFVQTKSSVDIPGMNIAIPINRIKTFMNERGLVFKE